MPRLLPVVVSLLLLLAGAGAAGASTLAPLPPPPKVNQALAELGRLLFFDTRLSGDLGRSCASCHAPAQGWADGRPLSRAYPGSEYFRNAPGLLNVVHRKRLMWDGRLDGADLPTAVRDMVTEAHFMNADGRLVQERIAQVREYRELSERIWGAASTPYGPQLFVAVGEFLKTLTSREAPIDAYLRGDARALTSGAKAGLKLFTGKAGCSRCHGGAMFSDAKFHRTGVAENPAVWNEPLRTLTMLRHYATSGMPNYMNARSDLGVYAISKVAADRGRFLTPSLRELKHTAPYMHNGTLASLAEVIEFYDHGGGPGSELRPLGLTAREKRDLESFLEALSGKLEPFAIPLPPEYQLHDSRHAVSPAPTFLTSSSPSSSPQPPPAVLPLATLAPVPVPADNPQTPEKVELGRLLYFDPRLSGDGSTPCFSCHFPQRGWGEGGAKSRGYPGTWHWRNAQTVINAAYYGKLNWDGAANSLEHQAAGAAEGSVAGNGDAAMMEMRLRLVPDYVERFRRVFGLPWPRMTQAYQAIAAYQRTIVSDPRQVPLDRYLGGDDTALSAEAKRGLRLFAGKAGCQRCHHGALVSDQRLHATGVPEPRAEGMTPLLRITHRWQNYQRGVTEKQFRESDADLGLYYVTKRSEDIGKFRTPSLRELRYTAPYMHNGVFSSLREVVDFYDQGGGVARNKPDWLRPLNLGEEEKRDLVAFLEAMSMDQPLLDSAPNLPNYSPLTGVTEQ